MGIARSSRGTSDAATRWAAFLALVSVGLAFLLVATPARAQPPAPMIVHGHALDITGVPLPVGTPVRALVDGVVYSNDSKVSDATGAYSLFIVGNWMGNGSVSETPTVKEGADLGDVVVFAAGDFTNTTLVFQETVTWIPGAVVAQDLHLGDSGYRPGDVKIQAVVTQPARLDQPYVLLCNAYPAGVGLGGYYLQVDAPGSYAGAKVSLAGTLPPGGILQVNISDSNFFDRGGDALKLVFLNTNTGIQAPAGGRDFPVDRIEFNATVGGTLDWEPGSTIMGSAPAPGPGLILNRSTPCGDTNSPRDFVLEREPGLPAISTVSVTIVAPTSGQVVPGGQTFIVLWNLGSNTFTQFAYLRVWVNVSYAGTQVTLVPGIGAAQNASWDVPDIAEPAAVVNVTVIDAFGARASRTVTFAIQLQSPWPIVAAVLIVVVIVVSLLFAFLSRRQPRAPPPTPPGGLPPQSAPLAGLPVSPAPSTASPPQTTKVCPQCGTQVKAEDASCFFCGYLFVTPPPP